jgi:FixJ family two-component response regulator
MSRSSRPRIPIGTQDSIVYVVDDDVRIREAMQELFTSLDVPSATFGSVAEYVAYPKPDLPACLVLDVELPDINGLDFQRQLRDAYHPPIVFITGYGDIPSSVRAIKDGAVDFLAKPFSEQDLMAAIETAVARDRHARLERAERARLEQRYASLTPRESQVLPLIVSGLLNKQSAAELGISEVTLQIHRSRIMQKMAAESFADLVRLAAQLNIGLGRWKQQ